MTMRTSTAAALTSLALAACGGGASGDGPGGGGGPPPTPVEVAAARTDTVVDAILATGTIEAVQSIELRPEVQGRLTEILVREGREVTAGTPLFKVDDAELTALVAQLTAERDRAVQALERTKGLLAENASSEADLEEAEANARSRQAQLELQQVRLERTVVRAPFSGVVGARFVSLGDYVTTSTRLTTLHTVDPQRVAFQVPERYAERLAVGQEITFRVAAIDRQSTGTVDFVDPVVQVPARTILVKARAANRDRLFKPGMFVEVRLASDVRPNAIVVPEDAILPLEGVDFVWVAKDGTVSRRQVTLGVRTPGFVEVSDGLTSGEQVVVGGLQRLFEGAPVVPTVVER
ncbi:MAG: efflux RND transporter periplasmic adaptor subunit [Gemmatimonadota bacterium]|nr:efflux RND transporter periplasmic adaptor subunit [Gemmatimonadota bacterium]MDH3479609.1 efflux RND transporter periplasmic adaptor subunit [Gemmatimonadota bacterium]MDH5550234.1 efflux RND transporter periplasmic adaptor subunit [Gemmatimonadota bacterium]